MSTITSAIAWPVRLGSWLDDRINPIVVKELRQSVKSRFVVAVLMLLLVILLISLMATLMNMDLREVDDGAGAELFMLFQGILLATCMLFVPVYVGVRLAAERATTTSDLLYITTIRPSSIIWGKLLAGMVVTALAFSACVPFMVITFLLRGIDLPTIFFILGLDALTVLAATQLAIFIATMPLGWPIKLLLGLVMLAISGMVFVGLMDLISDVLLGYGVGSLIDEPDFWLAMGVGIGGWVAAVALVFLLSVSIISPPTANRAPGPRLYFTFLVLATLGTFVFLSLRFQQSEFLTVWLYFAVPILAIAAMISGSERDRWGPRLRRAIPRNRVLRPLAFLLYSGAAGGLIWSAALYFVAMIGIAGGIYLLESGWASGWLGTVGLYGYSGDFIPDWEQRFASVGFWVYGYLLLSVLICRRLLKATNGAVGTGVVALCLMAAASILPMIIAYAVDPKHWDMKVEYWLILNPFGPMMCGNSDWSGLYGGYALPLSAAFFSAMVMINIPWFARQIADFRPPRDSTIDAPRGGDSPDPLLTSQASALAGARDPEAAAEVSENEADRG